MTRMWRASSGVLLLIGAAACGTNPPPEPAVTPTPAVHELARLQDMGRLDGVRLSCAAQAAIPVVAGARDFVREPRPATPRSSADLSRHAQSVQASMSGSERTNASMRRATAARTAAAAAAARGDQTLAVRASSSAAWALRAAHQATPTSGEVYVSDTRWEAPVFDPETAPLLLEYAELWAAYLAPDGSGEMPPRLVEIGQASPEVMETYARVLLVSYEDPLLTCPES